MGYMESEHDEPLFKNYVTLLLGLTLQKRSRTKKITFENLYYGEIKQKLNFFDTMMCGRFDAKKMRLSSQRTQSQR